MVWEWLDIARYADTKGYEKDQHRDIWPYRDWVIRALNADMPFDRFTREQIAGDLIPGATDDQILATAFHRNTMTNDEDGTDDEEFRVAAVLDRVNTTMEVWQGTTMGCVQCHSHPYDPFRHKDYYRQVAFFNNSADADNGPVAASIMKLWLLGSWYALGSQTSAVLVSAHRLRSNSMTLSAVLSRP